MMKFYRKIRYDITSALIPLLVSNGLFNKLLNFRPHSMSIFEAFTIYLILITVVSIVLLNIYAPMIIVFYALLALLRCTSIVLPLNEKHEKYYSEESIMERLLKYRYQQTAQLLGTERAIALYRLMCRVCVAGVMPRAIANEFIATHDELGNLIEELEKSALLAIEKKAVSEIAHDIAEGRPEGKLMLGHDAALLVETLRNGRYTPIKEKKTPLKIYSKN